MSSGGEDLGRLLRMIASVALTFLIVALLALLFAPRDPGTLTIYGLVIGLNLLIFLAYWPAVKWLRHFSDRT
jgi:hypothetical protein